MRTRVIITVVCATFAITMAVTIAYRLSSEAMAVILGVLVGVMASIPTSLLIAWIYNKSLGTQIPMREAPAPQEKIVVVQSPPQMQQQQHGYSQLNSPMVQPQQGQYQPQPQAPSAQRKFTIIGGADVDDV